MHLKITQNIDFWSGYAYNIDYIWKTEGRRSDMVIGGFQKLTLLDYPEHIACIVFTKGCSFRCPFCHNAGLVLPERDDGCRVSEDEILHFLKKRRTVLEGVVITGGEPLIWADLEEFLHRVKQLGYKIKLDTNGSFPQRLEWLLKQGLLDYVALDIKQAPERYESACGVEGDEIVLQVERSLSLLKEAGISFEMRTTLVKGIHRIQDIRSMAAWVGGAGAYYLQSYADSGHVLSPEGLSAFSDRELEEIVKTVRAFCPSVSLRR